MHTDEVFRLRNCIENMKLYRTAGLYEYGKNSCFQFLYGTFPMKWFVFVKHLIAIMMLKYTEFLFFNAAVLSSIVYVWLIKISMSCNYVIGVKV